MSGQYTKEDILQELLAIISDKEMEEMNYFYSRKKEEISHTENYSYEENNTEKPKIEEVANQEQTDIWTNRFKGWYGAIDRIPESARAKFVKMKSDIVNSIKSLFKEKSSPTHENVQNQDTTER